MIFWVFVEMGSCYERRHFVIIYEFCFLLKQTNNLKIILFIFSKTMCMKYYHDSRCLEISFIAIGKQISIRTSLTFNDPMSDHVLANSDLVDYRLLNTYAWLTLLNRTTLTHANYQRFLCLSSRSSTSKTFDFRFHVTSSGDCEVAGNARREWISSEKIL